MRFNDRSSEVKKLQNKLKKMGYNLAIDGIFGQETMEIILSFQSAFDLKIDGIVGKNTSSKIDSIYKIRNSRNLNTKHFNQSEFKCRCCGKNPGIYLSLLLNLELVRYKAGENPVSIYSGYRCKKHNIAVKGATKSQHLYAKAADIHINGISMDKLYKICDKVFSKNGVGRYPTFVHVDIRSWKARW
jgi:hypothetical protein